MKFMSLALVATIAATCGHANAQPWNAALERGGQERTSVIIHGAAQPPIGHVEFCMRNPDECVAKDAGNMKVRLTDKAREQLMAVNARINELIKPMSDKEQYGEIERWTYPVSGMGDCEDYVLLKKFELARLGWPHSALLITVVRDEMDEGHAVLTVRTDQGDLVLDNKHSRVLAWHETGYAFIKRQSAVDPREWVSLIPRSSPPTVAASGGEERR